MIKKAPINWTNTLFLIFTPLVGVIGTILLCLYSDVHWATWLLAGITYFLSGTAISAGYHRFFAHQTFKASWIVRLLLLLFAAATFEGDVLDWCTDHREHHLYTDTDKDPYDIKKGFWFAHMGWLIRLDPNKRNFDNVKDLIEDPLVRFQHRFFVPLAIFMGFILPMIIASFWGNALAGLIIAGALRIAVVHHCTFFINSLCHMLGSRPYSTKQSARDHWLTAILTFGEGYHNFHHQFPLDYRNGVRWYHFDSTKWLLNLLRPFRLVTDFKTMSPQKLVKYKVHNRVSQLKLRNIELTASQVLKPIYDRIAATIAQMDELEKMADRKNKAIRNQLKKTRRELNQLFNTWTKLTQRALTT